MPVMLHRSISTWLLGAKCLMGSSTLTAPCNAHMSSVTLLCQTSLETFSSRGTWLIVHPAMLYCSTFTKHHQCWSSGMNPVSTDCLWKRKPVMSSTDLNRCSKVSADTQRSQESARSMWHMGTWVLLGCLKTCAAMLVSIAVVHVKLGHICHIPARDPINQGVPVQWH